MKKQSHRFFFRLHPSNQLRPSPGAATHYAENSGIIEVDPLVASYIARCVRNGVIPTLFVQGWGPDAHGTFSVGMAIPRERSSRTDTATHTASIPTASSLIEMFTE